MLIRSHELDQDHSEHRHAECIENETSMNWRQKPTKEANQRLPENHQPPPPPPPPRSPINAQEHFIWGDVSVHPKKWYQSHTNFELARSLEFGMFLPPLLIPRSRRRGGGEVKTFQTRVIGFNITVIIVGVCCVLSTGN